MLSTKSKLIGGLVGLLWFVSAAYAQEWPNQPVTIVVPYPPGGAADIMARRLSERLATRWRQPVVVENRAGGNEIIGAISVIKARPDGYTLLFATEVGLETNAFLYSKLPYDPKLDFTPITRVAEGPLVYVVRNDSPVRNMRELIAAAKDKPGTVSYGSSGAGGSMHLAVNWLGVVAGNVDFLHVPYKGAAPAVVDLLGGLLHFTAPPLSVVAPYIKDNRLRPIATTGAARIRSLPEVPTLTELGYRDSVIQFMFALVGPAKLPPEIASRIAADVGAVMRDPEMQSRSLEPFGFVLAVETPAEFAQFLTANQEKQRRRVKAANVQLD